MPVLGATAGIVMRHVADRNRTAAANVSDIEAGEFGRVNTTEAMLARGTR